MEVRVTDNRILMVTLLLKVVLLLTPLKLSDTPGFCDTPALKLGYFAFIRSNLSYGSSVYGGTTTSNFRSNTYFTKKCNPNYFTLKIL